MEQNTILLELQYLPPIQYFTKFIQYKNVLVEQYEHYSKRSYRNRCHIATANGMQRLSIPLKKGKNEQQPIRKVVIDYSVDWQKNHWAAFLAAYGNAPFFEHYVEYFQPFYTKKVNFLFDFNLDLLKTILPILGFKIMPNLSDSFQKETTDQVLNFRNLITPKRQSGTEDSRFKAMKYSQVFEDKNGFIPNLSILDLIFCTGPQAAYYLENSIR